MDAFNKAFGTKSATGEYELSPSWQAGITNSMLVGQIIGLCLNGFVADRLGYKRTTFLSLVMVICFIFVSVFASSLGVLLLGQFLLGIPLGVFQTLAGAYATDICPLALRSYLTTFINACWCIGQLLASGVLRGVMSRTDVWAYKLPFCCQFAWPIPLMIGIWFAPESPYWLVRQGRIEEAEHVVERLGDTSDEDFCPRDTVELIRLTNESEKATQHGTTYLDCFRGNDLRRTEICCLTWACQCLCGSGLMAYSVYFFRTTGLDAGSAFSLSLGQYGIGLFGTILSWMLISRFGLRTLYFAGLVNLDILLLIIGVISITPTTFKTSLVTGVMLLCFSLVYNSTVGPICYSLVNELTSTRLRQKTLSLARSTYSLCAIFNGVIIPYMLNSSAWDWAGHAGFFWGGVCFLCAVYVFFRLPEPKNRTSAELHALFENKISARKFSTTKAEGLDKVPKNGPDGVRVEIV